MDENSRKRSIKYTSSKQYTLWHARIAEWQGAPLPRESILSVARGSDGQKSDCKYKEMAKGKERKGSAGEALELKKKKKNHNMQERQDEGTLP